jgi:GGDEF domain-containing protein
MLLRSLLESERTGVLALADDRIAYASPGVCKIRRGPLPDRQSRGRRFTDLLAVPDRHVVEQANSALFDLQLEVWECSVELLGLEPARIHICFRRAACSATPMLELLISEVSSQPHERAKVEAQAAAADTELPGRVALTEAKDRALVSAQLQDESLALQLVNLDGFGKLSRVQGSATGKAALQITADCLKITVRSNEDLLGHYGSDEFLLVLPHRQPRYRGINRGADRPGARASHETG